MDYKLTENEFQTLKDALLMVDDALICLSEASRGIKNEGMFVHLVDGMVNFPLKNALEVIENVESRSENASE